MTVVGSGSSMGRVYQDGWPAETGFWSVVSAIVATAEGGGMRFAFPPYACSALLSAVAGRNRTNLSVSFMRSAFRRGLPNRFVVTMPTVRVACMLLLIMNSLSSLVAGLHEME